MRRLPAALLLLCTGCPAYLLSGVTAGVPGRETFSSRPEEADARLRCGELACSEAAVERPIVSGRSTAVFWVAFAAEMLGGAGLYQAGGGSTSSSNSSSGGAVPPSSGGGSSGGGPLAIAGGALVALGLVDLVAWFVRSPEFGDQRQPLRLERPVTADWRGARAVVPLEAIVPPGTNAVPATFSLARMLGGAPAASSSAPAVALAAPPPLVRPAADAFSDRAAPAPSSARAAGRAIAAGGKLAVLDFKSYAKDLREEDVRYFADVVRGATLRAAPQLVVMTRENLIVLLQASGRDLSTCEGECEVDTGRRLGADAVVSGEILKVGSRYKLTLRLHETRAGRLLSSSIASGKTIDELDESAAQAVSELTAPLR